MDGPRTGALTEGLEPEIIDVVKYRKPITGMGDTEALIITFGRELIRDKYLRSETFARAVATFGQTGVLDLAALMGNYAMTALILTAFDQHVHPDRQPLLPTP